MHDLIDNEKKGIVDSYGDPDPFCGLDKSDIMRALRNPTRKLSNQEYHEDGAYILYQVAILISEYSIAANSRYNFGATAWDGIQTVKSIAHQLAQLVGATVGEAETIKGLTGPNSCSDPYSCALEMVKAILPHCRDVFVLGKFASPIVGCDKEKTIRDVLALAAVKIQLIYTSHRIANAVTSGLLPIGTAADSMQFARPGGLIGRIEGGGIQKTKDKYFANSDANIVQASGIKSRHLFVAPGQGKKEGGGSSYSLAKLWQECFGPPEDSNIVRPITQHMAGFCYALANFKCFLYKSGYLCPSPFCHMAHGSPKLQHDHHGKQFYGTRQRPSRSELEGLLSEEELDHRDSLIAAGNHSNDEFPELRPFITYRANVNYAIAWWTISFPLADRSPLTRFLKDAPEDLLDAWPYALDEEGNSLREMRQSQRNAHQRGVQQRRDGDPAVIAPPPKRWAPDMISSNSDFVWKGKGKGTTVPRKKRGGNTGLKEFISNYPTGPPPLFHPTPQSDGLGAHPNPYNRIPPSQSTTAIVTGTNPINATLSGRTAAGSPLRFDDIEKAAYSDTTRRDIDATTLRGSLKRRNKGEQQLIRESDSYKDRTTQLLMEQKRAQQAFEAHKKSPTWSQPLHSTDYSLAPNEQPPPPQEESDPTQRRRGGGGGWNKKNDWGAASGSDDWRNQENKWKNGWQQSGASGNSKTGGSGAPTDDTSSNNWEEEDWHGDYAAAKAASVRKAKAKAKQKGKAKSKGGQKGKKQWW